MKLTKVLFAFFCKIRQSSLLFYNTVHSLATAIFSVIISLLTSAMIARSLGPASKGSVDIIFATTSLLVMVFGLSLTSGIVYVIAKGKSSISKLVDLIIIFSFIQSLFAGIFLLSASKFDIFSEIIPRDVQDWSILAIILLIFLNLIINYYYSIFVGFQDFVRANYCGIIGKFVYFLILLSFFISSILGFLEFSDKMVVWLSVISSVVSVFIFRFFAGPLFGGDIGKNSAIREIFIYSMPAYLANVVQYFSYRLDIFIVGFFTDLRGVGLYALSLNISQSIWLFSGTISNVLYPNIASTVDKNLAYRRTARVTRLTFLINVLLSIILAFFGKNFLIFIFGEKFRESISPMLWLLPGVAIFGITNVISSYVVGVGKPVLTLWFAILCLVATVFLDIFLIPLYGIEGAAIASSIAYIATALFSIFIFVRETGVNPLKLIFPEKEDLLFVIDFFRGHTSDQIKVF